MRVDPARPDLTVEMEWFFCPPGAKIFAGPTAFSSRNYTEAREDADLTLGEVEVTKRWVRGDCPPGVTGQFFCGDPTHAAAGCDLVNGPIVPLDPYDGVLLCCRGGVPFGDDDVRDINYWRMSGANLPECWYLAGGPFKVPYEATISLSQDTDYLVPYFPSSGLTVDEIGVFLTAATGGLQTARLAIYEAISEDNISPGQLVAETGDISLAVAGGIGALPVGFAFDRLKLYWVGVNLSDNTGIMLGGIQNGIAQGIFGSSSSVLGGRNGVTRARAYGPWPATYPALVDADIDGVTPCVAFLLYL